MNATKNDSALSYRVDTLPCIDAQCSSQIGSLTWLLAKRLFGVLQELTRMHPRNAKQEPGKKIEFENVTCTKKLNNFFHRVNQPN